MKLFRKAKKNQTKKQSRNSSSLFFAAFLLLISAAYVGAQSVSNAVLDRRAQLQRELDQLEGEITQYEQLVNQKQKEGASLERDITILKNKITQTRLEIRAIDLSIEQLQGKIVDKEETIQEIEAKVEREKRSLAELLRKYQEYDDLSLVELLFSYDRVSDFLQDVDSVDVVQASLQGSFDRLRSVKTLEETAKVELEGQKTEKDKLRAVQDLEKKKLETNQKQQATLLKETRGKESEYKKIVTTKKKDAATIRTELFLLQGSPAIPFEKAMLYAERAEAKTGVRAAFVLGVVAQESELGKNIGQCNLPDDPPKYRWQNIMKPSRDIEPYKRITSKLGLDPEKMPLSCPMSVGWGGAMGPAQFIPSTWELYEAKIARATGHDVPNPWDPEDAFMASAIYLGEIGASSQSGERMAAAKYFAGSNWQGTLGRTYANQVLDKVEKYQEQIDILKGVASR